MPIHVLNGVPDYDAELNGVGAADWGGILDNIGKGISTATDVVNSGLTMATNWKDANQQRELMRHKMDLEAQMADANARMQEANARVAAAQVRLAQQQANATPALSSSGGTNTKKMLLIGGGVLMLGIVAMMMMKKK